MKYQFQSNPGEFSYRPNLFTNAIKILVSVNFGIFVLQTISNAEALFFPLFGLVPKLGPIKDWGLKIENNAIKVNNSLDYQTNIDGIYAIGDVNTYPGKLKLILSGFHEAAVMCHSAYSKLNPGKKNTLKYTTVSGIQGFDGSKKEAKKSQISKID